MKEIRLSRGEGRHLVNLIAVVTSEGVTAALLGGEKPHVGGVVTCVPRLSLTGQGMSCDTWVTPVPGHKDTEAAVPVAELICRRTGHTTVVTAGLHIARADQSDIKKMLENSLEAAGALAEKIREIQESHNA